MLPNDRPSCPKCGYTYQDCLTHLDHHLCGEPDPADSQNQDMIEDWLTDELLASFRLGRRRYDQDDRCNYVEVNAGVLEELLVILGAIPAPESPPTYVEQRQRIATEVGCLLVQYEAHCDEDKWPNSVKLLKEVLPLIQL